MRSTARPSSQLARAHVPASEIAVSSARDIAKAQRFADRGVQVRRGDYADPTTLPDAFADADQLLLVSSNDPGADAEVGPGTASAIDAAAAVGVGRILYTSRSRAPPPDSPFRPLAG